MTDKKRAETASEVLSALREFLEGPVPDFKGKPIDEVQRYLDKQGVDSEKVLESVRVELDHALGSLKLEEARRRRADLLAGLARGAARTAGRPRETLLRLIRERAGQQQVAAYARKLESASDDDLESILEDLDLLRALERWDDDGKS